MAEPVHTSSSTQARRVVPTVRTATKRFLAVAVVFACAAFAAIIAVSGDANSSATTPTPLDQISAHGVPAPPGGEVALAKVSRGSAASFVWKGRLAVKEGRAFYRLTKDSGSECFALGEVDAPDLYAAIGCPADFPSAGQPVFDFTLLRRQSFNDPWVWKAAGFAADGVASVALVDAKGRTLATATVTDNTYAFAERSDMPVALLAMDASGKVLARVAIPQPPAGT